MYSITTYVIHVHFIYYFYFCIATCCNMINFKSSLQWKDGTNLSGINLPYLFYELRLVIQLKPSHGHG
jgi:hypothetical protein